MNCKKCNSDNLSIVKSGPHNKLICSECNSFQKFLSKEDVFDFNSVCVDRSMLIRVDSLLSCLKHRHGSYLEKVNEYDEVNKLGEMIKEHIR